MTHLERAQDIYRKLGEGDGKGAIETYYADNVEIIEADGSTFNGRETQLKRLEEWQAGVEEFHGGGVHSVTANEETGTTVVESWTDMTPKGGPRMKFEETAVQQWEDGKIVRERFYYWVPAEAQQQMQQAQNEASS